MFPLSGSFMSHDFLFQGHSAKKVTNEKNNFGGNFDMLKSFHVEVSKMFIRCRVYVTMLLGLIGLSFPYMLLVD